MRSRKLLLGAIMGMVLLGNIFSPALAQEETKPSSKVTIRPVPEFRIEVWTDKESYIVGEDITIYFKSNKDSYLTLFDFTPGAGVRLLFPNRYQKNNFLAANKVHIIPPGFGVTPPTGKEMFRAIATTSPWQFFSDEEIMRYHDEHPEERYPVISGSEEGFAGKFNKKIEAIPRPNWTMANCIFNVTSKAVSQYGRIKVTSSPSYAKVSLNGLYRGQTPLTLNNIKVGQHTVKVTKTDYYNYSETVQVKGNSTTYLSARLEPLSRTGSIYINSTPSRAKAYLDGAYQGKTPLTISNLEVGKYRLSISKNGYYDWYSTVQIKQNITTQVLAQLEPTAGSLYVTSLPRYAKVFLDGIEQGSAPLTITNLEEGWHEIVIMAEYYRVYVEYLYIYEGEQTEVEGNLDRI